MLIVREMNFLCEGTRRNRKLKPRLHDRELIYVSALITALSEIICNLIVQWWSWQSGTIMSLKPWEGPLTPLVGREVVSPIYLFAKALYTVFVKKRGISHYRVMVVKKQALQEHCFMYCICLDNLIADCKMIVHIHLTSSYKNKFTVIRRELSLTEQTEQGCVGGRRNKKK